MGTNSKPLNRMYQKRWFEKNREKQLQRLRKRIRCEVCNVDILFGHRYQHYSTDKHQKNFWLHQCEHEHEPQDPLTTATSSAQKSQEVEMQLH